MTIVAAQGPAARGPRLEVQEKNASHTVPTVALYVAPAPAPIAMRQYLCPGNPERLDSACYRFGLFQERW